MSTGDGRLTYDAGVRVFAIAIGLSVLGSFGSLLLASGLLLLKPQTRTALVPHLVSYAVGTLLGVALLSIIPEVLADLEPARMGATLLAGIITFFILEKRCCGTTATPRTAKATRTGTPTADGPGPWC